MFPLLLIGLLGVGVWYYETQMKKNPSSGPPVTDQQSLSDAQMMLATWAPTQGAQYSATEPMSYWVQLFQNWADHGGVAGSVLGTDGILDASTLATLQYWFQHQQGGAPAPSGH